jgi:hypothetical protein
MSAVHYDSYTEARANLKDMLDAAERGRVATLGDEQHNRHLHWHVAAGDGVARFITSEEQA